MALVAGTVLDVAGYGFGEMDWKFAEVGGFNRLQRFPVGVVGMTGNFLIDCGVPALYVLGTWLLRLIFKCFLQDYEPII
jgi:hypothetical protein